MSYGLAASDRQWQWQWQWPDLYTFSNTDTNVELGRDSNYAMVNGMPTILDAFGNTSCLQMHLEVQHL